MSVIDVLLEGIMGNSQLTARYFPLAVTRFVSHADAVTWWTRQLWRSPPANTVLGPVSPYQRSTRVATQVSSTAFRAFCSEAGLTLMLSYTLSFLAGCP